MVVLGWVVLWGMAIYCALCGNWGLLLIISALFAITYFLPVFKEMKREGESKEIINRTRKRLANFSRQETKND